MDFNPQKFMNESLIVRSGIFDMDFKFSGSCMYNGNLYITKYKQPDSGLSWSP
jgi:hypothetical protein